MTRKKKKVSRTPAPEQKKYKWRPASRFTRLDPQSVGEELERIRVSHGIHVTAEQIVESASDPMSPIHKAFPWDDARAAHEHRLETARSLLRSIETVRVVIIGGEPKEIRVGGFKSTPAKKPNARQYTTTEYAMGDPELRAHVLRQALQELAAFRRKYAELSELAIVFAAIDTTRKKAG